MAGIATATKVQIENAYRAALKLEQTLRFFNQGTDAPGTIGAARIAEVNAATVAAVAAIALLNT